MGDRGGAEAMEAGEEDYLQLKDLKLTLDLRQEQGLHLSFWLYISACSHFPAPILHQVQSDGQVGAPLLALSNDKRITLFPLLCLVEESSSSPHISTSGNSFPSTEGPSVILESEFSMLGWIHVGCQVSRDYACLYIDGNIMGETCLSSVNDKGLKFANLEFLALVGNGLDGKLHGYIHDFHRLPKTVSVVDHFHKNPPVQLSVDLSCMSDGVEECRDGIMSIVGGKMSVRTLLGSFGNNAESFTSQTTCCSIAIHGFRRPGLYQTASCRRNFTLEVMLLDFFGRPVHKEMELFASLVYADNGARVEREKDEFEAPLLISYDGVEYPSMYRPVKIIHGRASFKLKISQLSSKCDNRFFRVLFRSTDVKRFSFIHAYSPPIHCISRNPKTRAPSILGGQPASRVHIYDGSHPQAISDGSQNIEKYNTTDLQVHDDNISKPALKRAKLGTEMKVGADGIQPISNGYSSSSLRADDDNGIGTSEENFEQQGRMDDLASDSESTDAKHSISKINEEIKNLLSDRTIFRYCLEGTDERYLLLKEIGLYAAEQDIQNFAEQVSVYSGCSHHWYQIMMSKKLVQEGISSWHAISKGNTHAPWIDSLPEIIRRFRKISRSSRALSGQDIEVLHKIAGSGDEINCENFNKLWSWLYPIACTISMEQINDIWECTSPKWIEGLITTKEAENALRSSGGLRQPGLFVLRFPTSRSWPHPDAGSLLVSFVGADHAIHNKLLSLDARNPCSTPLADLLLEEPELTQLARVTRLG